MANKDLESAMSDLFEVMSIAAAGYPPHLMDRYAEIVENNDKTLVVLKKKRGKALKKWKAAQQKVNEAEKRHNEMMEKMRVNELRIKKLKELIRLNELETEKLQKEIELSTSTNDTEKDAKTD